MFCLSKKNNGDNYMLFFFSEVEEMILALSECDNYFSTWTDLFSLNSLMCRPTRIEEAWDKDT